MFHAVEDALPTWGVSWTLIGCCSVVGDGKCFQTVITYCSSADLRTASHLICKPVVDLKIRVVWWEVGCSSQLLSPQTTLKCSHSKMRGLPQTKAINQPINDRPSCFSFIFLKLDINLHMSEGRLFFSIVYFAHFWTINSVTYSILILNSIKINKGNHFLPTCEINCVSVGLL